MTIKYYMRPDSNTPPRYTYIVGEDTDSLWNAETCIEVDPMPSSNYEYDLETSAWVLNETYYMADLRSKRNIELARTDKYVTEDFPFNADEKIIALQYRQDLRERPDKELLVDRVLPDCPECCEP